MYLQRKLIFRIFLTLVSANFLVQSSAHTPPNKLPYLQQHLIIHNNANCIFFMLRVSLRISSIPCLFDF